MRFIELFEDRPNMEQVKDIATILASGKWIDYVEAMDYVYPQPKHTIQNICNAKGYPYTTGMLLFVSSMLDKSGSNAQRIGEDIVDHLIKTQRQFSDTA